MADAMQSSPRLSIQEFEQIFASVCTWGRWGPNDERGTLNYLTPERTRAAAQAVRTGRTVTLALPINTVAGPDNPKPAQHFMATLGDAGEAEEPRFACDFIGMEMHGDAHSHIDALCHCIYRGRLYNGVPASSITSRGAAREGMDVLASGIVGRGVLLDIPRLRGVRWLDPGTAVLPDELDAAEAAQGVRLGEGDILLLRTGHHRRRLELGAWNAAEAKAGLHPSAMLWLHARRVAAFGADGDGDAIPSPVEAVAYPIHTLGMNAMGMPFLDSLQFEDLVEACEAEGRWAFLIVVAPLRLVGGTGSPVNPIAVF